MPDEGDAETVLGRRGSMRRTHPRHDLEDM